MTPCKKRILVTGATGFVGRSILPGLGKRYTVYAPTRFQLNILDTDAVEQELKHTYYDAVILAAIPTPVRGSDRLEADVLNTGLLSFMNFYRLKDCMGKLFHFGSGAEFDKSRDITQVSEESLAQYMPSDPYGLSKYIESQLCRNSGNAYALRLFGCYGPTDGEGKFITHCIRRCMEGQPVTIRQNCRFDYLYAQDLVPVLCHFIENTPRYHDYNLSSGTSHTLYEIAEEVCRQMDSSSGILLLKEGLGKEYTASNQRLKDEIPGLRFTSLEQGIGLQIDSMLKERNM